MTANQRTCVLRCTNLQKKFSLGDGSVGIHVLKGIDFEVFEGEIVNIVGASGAGKSTLLHILGGLDRPTEGKVFWGTQDIFSLDDNKLPLLRAKAIGFVFQFHHLLPEFTALENVAIPAMILGLSSKEAEELAKELLGKVGLAERLEHRPAELSGGEQQRVAVARALVNRPGIILADEPSGNLDSLNAQQLHDLIIDLNRTRGQTFVIVTHNEKLTERSHRVLHIVDGNLKEY